MTGAVQQPSNPEHDRACFNAGLVQQTCACGWHTGWGDSASTTRQMHVHRIGCTAVTR